MYALCLCYKLFVLRIPIIWASNRSLRTLRVYNTEKSHINSHTEIKGNGSVFLLKTAKLEAAGCSGLRPDSEWFVDNLFISGGPISPPCCSELEVGWDYVYSCHVCRTEIQHFYLSGCVKHTRHIWPFIISNLSTVSVSTIGTYIKWIYILCLKFQYPSDLKLQQICDRLIYPWQQSYTHNHFFLFSLWTAGPERLA